MSRKAPSRLQSLMLLLLTMATAGPLAALVEPDRSSGVGQREFRHPDLSIDNSLQPVGQLPAQAAAAARADLSALGLSEDRGLLDVRGRRWGSLILTQPLVPGAGVGNTLKWPSGPPRNEAALREAAWNAFAGYLQQHNAQLRIDQSELAQPGKVTAHEDGALIQIHGPRRLDGILVRNSYVTAVVNQGNLVLFGSHNWGDINISTQPQVAEDDAIVAVKAHLGNHTVSGFWRQAELNIIPMAAGHDLATVPVGQGYAYRLAWVIRPTVDGDQGRWEALVDARSGDVLSFEDTNHYLLSTRSVVGGVYPETNDGSVPQGAEQAGWPMPFADVTNSGNTFTTDSGGNLLQCLDSTISTQLRGPYLLMNDNCGAINESASGNIDLGSSSGTDCTVPGGHSAGDTHSSRSGFYEMNRIKEIARSRLPANAWLRDRLQANMNINNSCNAYWNGTVNFYRSGGNCGNTGELAGVFDHEWGHGMDQNDAHPGIANPGEGIADIYAALRLNTSCIGRGFYRTGTCGGNGDPCTECTGVRDIDYAKRASGQPHTITWIDANCGSGTSAPCGGSVHCEGSVYAEAVWDLVHRDLQASPYNMDLNTALEVGTRLTYIGAGNVGAWYQCVQDSGGCPADSGYKQYLAADDDDGNLLNGTPHMKAIHAAFNRHGIACSAPTVQDSGCAGAPTTKPAVSTTPLDRGAKLSWNPVTGASRYQVFRTDGVFGCNFGKAKVADTTATSFTDSGLQNGRAYSYTVIPVGSHATCMGPASSCATVTPVAGANLDVDATSISLLIHTGTGDGDEFVDNCESATLRFNVRNIGGSQATNVRIAAVRPVSHPGISVVINPASPATVASCAGVERSFDFTAEGLNSGDTLVFEVDVTSDELNSFVKTQTLHVPNAETDFQYTFEKTWDFATDRQGWTPIQGTFNQSSASGADGNPGYVASSTFLDNQCDQIRSPVLRLTQTSTLTLWNQYDIENFSSSQWWDRANVAVFENGARNVVAPDSGRPYNASGAGATCVTANQSGWAASAPSWGTSGWSATALGSVSRAGNNIQLDIGYGTDGSVVGKGFWFDRVTVTDVEVAAADGQADSCGSCPDGICNVSENKCTCADDCGSPTSVEASCADTVDNDCDGFADCLDSDCTGDPACLCNHNEACDTGENCTNCASDCIAGSTSGAACGNGLCEAGNGEDCVSCPADCRGQQGGKPNGRFCCGDGGGVNAIVCTADDATVCNSGGFTCTDVPSNPGSYCCGDGTCEIPETGATCAIDCGPPCVQTETTETSCNDGSDNDCDGATDCLDTNCSPTPICCSLGGTGASCVSNTDCCSNNCKGKTGSKTCR